MGDCMGVFDVSDLLWTAPLARGAGADGAVCGFVSDCPDCLGFFIMAKQQYIDSHRVNDNGAAIDWTGYD